MYIDKKQTVIEKQTKLFKITYPIPQICQKILFVSKYRDTDFISFLPRPPIPPHFTAPPSPTLSPSSISASISASVGPSGPRVLRVGSVSESGIPRQRVQAIVGVRSSQSSKNKHETFIFLSDDRVWQAHGRYLAGGVASRRFLYSMGSSKRFCIILRERAAIRVEIHSNLFFFL